MCSVSVKAQIQTSVGKYIFGLFVLSPNQNETIILLSMEKEVEKQVKSNFKNIQDNT